jgi:arylsulfatase A-like enzyme
MHGRDEVLLGFPRKPDEVKKEIKDYYGAISYLDMQIGRILDALKKTGQYDNTIIIFAGDNGLALGQHGLLGKQSVYEHSVGVPMIWNGPGVTKNSRSKAYCYLTDIFPTLCDMLKIKSPQPMAGKSFIQCLTDPDKEARSELFFSFANIHRAVSDRHYKLIEYNVKHVRHTQLFDLQKDPWELKNLADIPEFAPIKERLRADLLKHKAETHDDTPFWKGF